MTRAVGVDLSLTGTGLAAIKTIPGGLDLDIRTVVSKGTRSDTLRQRRDRIYGIVSAVSLFAMNADLVVVEAPAFSKNNASTWDRAGLWWAVIDMLMLDQHRVAIAPPNVAKKFATNKGNADKPAVAVGMARLWGEECQCANDNEWDALTLATMAGQRLGIPDIPSRAHHAAALDGVAWDTEREAA